MYLGLAEWSVPSGGMFLWIRLLNVKDTFTLITEKARAAEVLFVPGQVFMIDESAPSPYIRASYSLVSPADMDKVHCVCVCVCMCVCVCVFYKCIVPIGFLPWEIRVAFLGKASCNRVALPNLRCMLGVIVFP